MDRDQRLFRRRTRVFVAALLLGLAGVGARAVQLQVYRHEELAKLATQQYLNDIRIPARRGQILDRNGKALAISVEVPSVFANPMEIDDPRTAARALSDVLGVKLETVYRRLASERLFVWLRRQVTPDVAERVLALKIPGVAITKESRRFYPNKGVAAHVIGFTGIDVSGLEGVERSMEEVLAGEPQVVQTLTDARGHAVLSGELDPEHRSTGADVYLALDLQIQHAAEVALRRGVEESGARAGVVVVLDVPTAGVLAAAVEPHFNLNRAGKARPAARRNRVFTDMFEPGSTLKPLVIAAALDAGVIKTDAKIFCENGAYTVNHHTIRDGRPYGWLGLTEVVARSSNIGAAKCGEALGKPLLHQYLRDFGFGRKPRVRFPGATAGMLRAPNTWSDLGLATISFGQGIAVSALQLAAGYRTLAAGGIYREPTLIRQVEHSTTQPGLVLEHQRRRVVSHEAALAVTGMMEAAVGTNGTAWRGAVNGYRVAGKTGTAQKIDEVAGGYSADAFMAVFGGFLPAEDPRVVIVVVVDEPQGEHHSGGVVAAPVFAEIAQVAMRQLGVIPKTTVVNAALMRARATAERREQRDAEQGIVDEPVPLEPKLSAPGTIPSFLGLTARQAMERYAELGQGLDIELRGSGRVVRQQPAPGSAGEGIRRMQLTLN